MQPGKRLLVKPSYKFYAIIVTLFILPALVHHGFNNRLHKPAGPVSMKSEAYDRFQAGDYESAIPILNTYLGQRANISDVYGVNRFNRLTGDPSTAKDNTVIATSSSSIKSAPRGRMAIVMQKLGLLANNANAKFTALNITKTGTVSDGKISSVAVYDDSNGNGKIDGGEHRLGGNSFSAGKTRVVFSESQTITLKPRYFLIAYDIMRNTQTDKTVGSKIAGPNSIEIDPPNKIKTLTGKTISFSGKIAKIQASSEKISLSHDPPKDIKASQGKENLVLDRISFSAPQTGDGVIVAGFRVDQIGTADDRSISSIKLVDDHGKTGVYEQSSDIVLDNTRLKNGYAEFKIPANMVAVDPGRSRHLLLLVNLSEEAKLGATVQDRIANQTYVKVSGPDKTSPFINANGRTITIDDKPDTLIVDQKQAGSTEIKVGSKDKLVQILDLSVNTDKATFKGLRLRLTGSLSDGYIDDVKLWLDGNDSKSVDESDRLLSTVKAFPKRTIDFSGIRLNDISKNRHVRLLVTSSVSADAPYHKTFACTIDKASDIDVASPDKALVAKAPERLRETVITTLPQTPTAPENIHATAKTGRQIAVNWNVNAEKQVVTGYKVFRSLSKSGPFSQVGTVETQTKTQAVEYVDTVPNTGSFWYRITAINESGESTCSASQTTGRVEIGYRVSTENSTATVKSADDSLALFIPKSKVYDKKTFTARSAIRPAGSSLKLISKHYFEFETDAKQPFDPPLTIMLECDKPVDDSVKIYHYKNGEWKPVTGGQYIYNENFIGYTNITEFSGYGAMQTDTASGYNDPPQYTDGPKGPHGGYVNGSNKCKDCHSVHLAGGLYRLTRANERDEACDYCHGIGGLASSTIVLDENGHDVIDTASSEIIAPDDTNPPYTISTTKWGCLECHSAHGNQTVELAGFSSDKLLKSNPNRGKTFLFYTPAVGETTQTISQWCTSCHNASFGSSSDAITVDESTTVFGHSSSGTGMTIDGEGYAEVDPDDGLNKGPTCKQCHKADSRQDITTGFPHASGSAASLLESDTASTKIDNACISCHKVSSLP